MFVFLSKFKSSATQKINLNTCIYGICHNTPKITKFLKFILHVCVHDEISISEKGLQMLKVQLSTEENICSCIKHLNFEVQCKKFCMRVEKYM